MRSETRIVQYVLRPNRLDPNRPDKTAFVILPYMDTDDWEEENRSFEKVRRVVAHIRNVDETIEQKIRLVMPRLEDQDPGEEEKEDATEPGHLARENRTRDRRRPHRIRMIEAAFAAQQGAETHNDGRTSGIRLRPFHQQELAAPIQRRLYCVETAS